MPNAVDLTLLSDLIKAKNKANLEIARLIGRPAQIGHVGEYIASAIFGIQLQHSASFKSIDGHFVHGQLAGRTVNIKWHTKNDGLLNITPDALPDYYLVLTGVKTGPVTSRGTVRPWTISNVFLFDAAELTTAVRARNVKIGVATSVTWSRWNDAEIYPNERNRLLQLSDWQRAQLTLFDDS